MCSSVSACSSWDAAFDAFANTHADRLAAHEFQDGLANAHLGSDHVLHEAFPVIRHLYGDRHDAQEVRFLNEKSALQFLLC